MSGEVDNCAKHGPYISLGGGTCPECRADTLTAKDAEIERLGYKIAQAYQTFGRLLDLCGIFETKPAQDILDYFSTAEDHVDEKWVEDYSALAALIRKASVQADGSVTHSLYGPPSYEPPASPTGDTW